MQGNDLVGSFVAIGFVAAYLLFLLGIFAFTLYIFWRLVSKTGHSGALSLLAFVPIGNLILLLYMAFGEWPVEKEIRSLKQELFELRKKTS